MKSASACGTLYVVSEEMLSGEIRSRDVYFVIDTDGEEGSVMAGGRRHLFVNPKKRRKKVSQRNARKRQKLIDSNNSLIRKLWAELQG